jgi:glutathione S-transferase
MEDGQKFLTQFLPLIEKQLSTHDYLTGNKLTLADICLLSCLDPAEVIEFSLSEYPSITKWRGGLQKQAFYKRVHQHFAEGMLSKL